MKKPHFTHYASFYGIPCYWGDRENNLMGRNWVYDQLVPIVAWLHNFYGFTMEMLWPDFETPGFPIQVQGELPEELAEELEKKLDALS